jgi:ribonuclease E
LTAAETEAHEAEKAARRRSTVREKVSFGSSSPEPVTPGTQQPQAAAPAEAHSEPAQETTTEATAPRRAGWWSRRFGGE